MSLRGFRVATPEEVVRYAGGDLARLRELRLLAPMRGGALPLANNGTGGTAGTTVTTANSGGASGSAWDAVSIGTSEADTYDDTFNVVAGAHMLKLTSAATVAANYVSWTTSLGTLSTNQTLGGRLYYVTPGTPTSSVRLMQILTTSTVLLTMYQESGSGNISIHNSAGTEVGTGMAGSALTANTLYRIEFSITGIGTTSGAFTVNGYTGNGSTLVGGASYTGTAASFGTTAPNTIRFGLTTANSSVSTAYYIGSMLVNSTGTLPGVDTGGGGATVAPTRPLVIPQAVQRAAVR